MGISAIVRILRPRSAYLARQYDRTDCGPAALLSVLRFWGGDAPLSRIRETAGTDVGGTTILGMLRAARALGFEARGVSSGYDALMRETSPSIAHLTLDDGTPHFVVCESAGAAGVWVGDPMEGRRRVRRATFERWWKSRALILLTPTPGLAQTTRTGWVRWFAGYLGREPVWFVQSLFLGGIGALLGVLTAVFIQRLIDQLIPEADGRTIVVAGIAIAFLLLLRSATEHLRQRLMIRMNREISLALNRDFLNHLLRLPPRFFETRTTGDITTRLADGLRIQRAFLETAGTAVIDGIILSASLAFLFLTSPPLGAIAALTIPLYGTAMVRASRSLREHHGLTMAAYGRVEGSYIDSIGSIEEIAGYGSAAPFVEANASLYRAFQGRTDELGVRHARLALFADLFGGAVAILSLVWGAILVIQGDLLLGGLVSGYTLLVGILPSVGRIVQGFASFQEASIAANRLRDLLLTPTEAWEGGEALVPIREMRLIDAQVEWPNGSRPFAKIDLHLKRGEMVGLSGSNGSGKSTLTRLLTRSIPLAGGELLVDGSPADRFGLGDYRTRILLLPNEVRLISGTVADNILFGRRVSGIEELEALVNRLGTGDFMSRFPDRWGTRIGEGGRRLSSGERQVTGLMRALLLPPDLLIVDEGIGSTDEGNTSVVLDAIERFSRDGMVLIVSHDPRVLARVNRLYRFQNGRLEDTPSPGAPHHGPPRPAPPDSPTFPPRRYRVTL